jgi:hypothetical protein
MCRARHGIDESRGFPHARGPYEALASTKTSSATTTLSSRPSSRSGVSSGWRRRWMDEEAATATVTGSAEVFDLHALKAFAPAA